MLFGLWHAGFDDIGDALKTSVPPQPCAALKVGADRRADAVGTMTAGTCSTGNLAVEDFLAERDQLGGRSGRHRETGVRMHALRRERTRRGFGLFRRRRRRLDRRIRIAVIGHAPDAAGLVVGDVERTVGSDGETRGPMHGAARLFLWT